MYFIHKHEVALRYGGPEEGGWWYEVGIPVDDWTPLAFRKERAAYDECWRLNSEEKDRAKREEDYDYHSVLAYRSTHYAYSVEVDAEMKPYPEYRPHYE